MPGRRRSCATSPSDRPMKGEMEQEDAKVRGLFEGRHRRLHRGAPTLGPRAPRVGVRALRGARAGAAGAPVRTPATRGARVQGTKLECGYRLDLVVDDALVVEIKCVDQLLPLHKAQLLTYLRLTKLPTGLLVNFRETVLKNGLRRLILSPDFASSRLPVNLSKPPDHSRDL